ncbi:MAG: hypothetical protein JSR82_08695 [Verrucomicrobia bacterium]|nr:hypothetical protein [Verrucomicrobiota bacterium]
MSPKKTAKAAPKSKPARKAARPATERRLVPVADGPIRADWLSRLEHARAEEARWEARLRSFEREGRLAYEVWMQQHFASRRADLQRLAEEIRGLEMVAEEIYAVSDRLRISEERAYAIVKGLIPDPSGYLGRLRSGALTEEDEDDFEEEGDDDDFVDFARDLNLDPATEAFARATFIEFLRAQGFSKKAAEQAWQMAEDEARGPRPEKPRRASAAPKAKTQATKPPTENQARELFRQIARRLHPDAGAGAMDERKLGLWHAAQQAWERRDLGGLEAVLWETEPDAAARGQAPVGAIARVVQSIRDRIKDLSRQWESIRQTPAGQFVGLDERQRERFRRRVDSDLRRDQGALEYAKSDHLAREEYWHEGWLKEAAREVRKARRGTSPKRKQAAKPGPGQINLPF